VCCTIEFQRSFLASADVVEALQLPADVKAESLGPIELRDIGSSVELLAITRTG
jgi:class 3 adenylate cyclase